MCLKLITRSTLQACPHGIAGGSKRIRGDSRGSHGVCRDCKLASRARNGEPRKRPPPAPPPGVPPRGEEILHVVHVRAAHERMGLAARRLVRRDVCPRTRTQARARPKRDPTPTRATHLLRYIHHIHSVRFLYEHMDARAYARARACERAWEISALKRAVRLATPTVCATGGPERSPTALGVHWAACRSSNSTVKGPHLVPLFGGKTTNANADLN